MLVLGGREEMAFDEATQLDFRFGEFLPGHANAMRFTATFADGRSIERIYYSIGGGASSADGATAAERPNVIVRYPFGSGEELLATGQQKGLSIAEIMWANEEAWRSRAETTDFLDRVRGAMLDCIDRGCAQDGILPGGLNVRRRAASLHRALMARGPRTEPSHIFEWVSLYALAVKEENAASGRVVTAPTIGTTNNQPTVLK